MTARALLLALFTGLLIVGSRAFSQQVEAPTVPALPAIPGQPAWPEKAAEKLKAAIEVYRDDPVSAFLTFVALRDDETETEKITAAEHRDWLESAIAALRPPVQKLIQQDYQSAIESDDLRAALIAVEIAAKVRQDKPEDLITDVARRLPSLAPLLESALQGKSKTAPIWKITDAKATRMPDYSESYGLSGLDIDAKDGHELVRVTATVENISATSDPVYVGSILPAALKLAFDMDAEERQQLMGPTRLASSRFLFLKTAEGNFPCQFVCKDADTLIGGGSFGAMLILLRITNTKVTSYPGSCVEQGKPFLLDVLFSVPQGVKNVELVFLGSPPVPVQE
jgi:hypothetical protein